MSLKTAILKLRESGVVVQRKTKLLAMGAMGTALTVATTVQPVAAASMNDSISPILTDVAALFTPLLALVIAAIPLIVAIAVIGFVLGILAAILGKLKI
jgi:hypothetical protein